MKEERVELGLSGVAPIGERLGEILDLPKVLVICDILEEKRGDLRGSVIVSFPARREFCSLEIDAKYVKVIEDERGPERSKKGLLKSYLCEESEDFCLVLVPGEVSINPFCPFLIEVRRDLLVFV